MNVLSAEKKKSVIDDLRKTPFSIGVDGSNDTDSKMHPIIVTYFDEKSGLISSGLLNLNPIKDRSTGKNIAQSIIQVFEKLDIPIKNCIAFGADNAPVMLGEKSGVAFFLKEKHREIIPIGCSCHLINLAAQKAAAVLPADIEQTVIDIFYFLEKSANRKESLKEFQRLHNTEIRKILKHVPTRWLSLNKCLGRLVGQWQPLLHYFLKEVKRSGPLECSLVLVKDSRERKIKDQISQKRKLENENDIHNKKKQSGEIHKYTVKKTCDEKDKIPNNSKPQKCQSMDVIQKQDTKFKKSEGEKNQNVSVSREEKIFYFLSSEKKRAYCHFLLYIIPDFETKNVILQSAAPHIHKLRDLLLDILKGLFLKFVKPSVVKNTPLLKVDYKNAEHQKEDFDLSVGNAAFEIVKTLKPEEQKEFYKNVRKYFTEACSYIVKKFPLTNDVLQNADVANLQKIEEQSFNKVRFFINKFPFLLPIKENETSSDAWDRLQEQFHALQAEDLNNVLKLDRADLQIHAIREIKTVEGMPKFDRISDILLSILVIPHSNAECERLFSMVKKNRTAHRSLLSDALLESLLTLKTTADSFCYEKNFSDELLEKAKISSNIV